MLIFCSSLLAKISRSLIRLKESPKMRTLFGYLGLLLISATLLFFAWCLNSFGFPTQQNNSNAREYEIQQRLKEAEVIWARAVANREKAIKVHKFPETDLLGMRNDRIFWDFFSPNFNCPHNVERVGRVGDGGKWICGIEQLIQKGNSCVVYSYGISNEISFETEILNRTNCSVHAYDHTIDVNKIKLPQNYPGRATISKFGLGVNNTGLLRTLKSEMDVRGHKFIDILKVDIEFAEYSAMDRIMQDFPHGLPFGQLAIELHIHSPPQEKNPFKTFKLWWDKLEAAGLRAFHNEPNLYNQLYQGQRSPKCYEYTFLNVKTDHSILHA